MEPTDASLIPRCGIGRTEKILAPLSVGVGGKTFARMGPVPIELPITKILCLPGLNSRS